MRAILECLVQGVKSMPRRREAIAVSTLDRLLESTISVPRCSSETVLQDRVRRLTLLEESTDFQRIAFYPLQFSPLLRPNAVSQSSVNRRVFLPLSSPCVQRRILSFQQTGLKQTHSPDRARDAWYLKIFAFFVLSALLTRSNSVLASENNTELSWDELKEVAEDLHIEGIDDPNALRQECFTRLMSLCLRERDSGLLKALDANKVVRLKDLGGNSLLIASIREGASTSVIRYLIQAERVSQVRSRDADGNTPLHIAAKEGLSGLIEDLWLYLNYKNNKGEAPIHLAIQHDREECVRRLRDRGARLDSLKCGEFELSPVALAVKAGARRALRVLSQNGEGMDQAIPNCGNVLHLSILFGQTGMAEFLFRDSTYFPKIQTLLLQEDCQGRIPFALACAKGDCEMALLLHDKGKTILNSQDLNYRDSVRGWTPAHWAAQQGQFPIIHLLGRWGAQLDILDHQGRRPEKVAEERLSGLDRETMITALESAQRMQAIGISDNSGFRKRLPQNIVLRGGGPKGIVYVGAFRALRDKRVDIEIDRAAGTSAGAISVCLYALGYSSDEMEIALGQKNLLQLLDPKNETCNAVLQAALTQKNTRSYVQSIKALISEGAPHILSSPGQAYRELSGMDGLCKGEDARNWIEGLIRSQVKKITGQDIPFLTFGELRSLKGRGFPFKHIRLFATSISGEKPRCFSSENKDDDHLIISDVVRASMSIPGVFEPHVLHTKDPKTGRRKADPDGGRYVDGGLLRNFPITTYDEPDGQINRRTLGLTLKEEKSELKGIRDPKTPIELVQAIASIYYEAETLLQDEEANNRVVEIPALGVSTLDFDLGEEKIKQLIQSGYDAVMTSPLFVTGIDESQNVSRHRTVCAPLSNFIGRSSDIKKLKECLQDRRLPFDKRLVVLLISGLPGIGKTELARKVIDEVLDPLDRSIYAFEIDYRNIDGGYREIARRLEIFSDEKVPSEEVRRKVRDALEQSKEPWFLILNNVEQDQKVDTELLPRFGGYALITAHSSEAWSDPDEHVQLGALEPEEGAVLIARITGEEISDDIRQLARRLSYYPLALDQVARFIRGSYSSGQSNNCTVKEYLRLYGDKFSSIDRGMASNEQKYKEKLKEVWDISFKHLKTKHFRVWEWLRFSSWFSPDNIPTEWIELWLLESGFQDSLVIEAKAIIGVLRSYGIARESGQNSNDRHLWMHDLLQEAVRTTSIDSLLDIESFEKSAAMILNYSKSYMEKIYEEKELLLSHINSVIDHAIKLKAEKSLLFAELLQLRGDLRMDRGEYKCALEDFEQTLRLNLQFQHNKPHPNVAGSLNKLGCANNSLGEYRRAIDCHEQSLAMLRQIHGDQPHSDVAMSLNNLGNAYENLGEYSRAIDYHGQSLTMKKQLYGDRPHSDVASSLIGLGNAYLFLGEYRQSIDYHEQSLMMFRQIYGDRPNSRVTTNLNNLGNAYFFLGEYRRAIDYHEQSLAMKKQIHGDRSHPDVASSLNNLGTAYYSLREYRRAIDYFEQSLAMRKQVYGNRPHPHIANSLNNLGSTYNSLREYRRAIDYNKQSLAMFKQIYGDQPNPNIATSLNNLGDDYRALGKHRRAISYYEQSLAMRKQIYGDRPHQDIAESLKGLGETYLSMNKYSTAVELFQSSYEMFIKAVGKDHPDAVNVKNILDEAIRAQKSNSCQIL